ncbi:MAG: hypothetical protein HC888_04140 [Candidatus Competibacteraceae bacterium]|nr:hypothetical protein [Candidatus Competibacteraceae bacterium]
MVNTVYSKLREQFYSSSEKETQSNSRQEKHSQYKERQGTKNETEPKEDGKPNK